MSNPGMEEMWRQLAASLLLSSSSLGKEWRDLFCLGFAICGWVVEEALGAGGLPLLDRKSVV